MKFGERAGWCVTLGIVLAQPRSCPQTSASAGFCPRCHNSGNRAWCTGLAATQVRVAVGKTGVVHTPGHALLLRLCIYRKHKKKTGDKSSALRRLDQEGPKALQRGEGRWRADPSRQKDLLQLSTGHTERLANMAVFAAARSVRTGGPLRPIH